MKYSKGFTLIELLVVITIIGILSTIGLASYRTANQRARNSKREADIQQVRSALESWRSDCGAYPTGINFAQLMADANRVCGGGNANFLQTYMGNRPVHDPLLNTRAIDYEFTSTAQTYTLRYTDEAGVVETFRNP